MLKRRGRGDKDCGRRISQQHAGPLPAAAAAASSASRVDRGDAVLGAELGGAHEQGGVDHGVPAAAELLGQAIVAPHFAHQEISCARHTRIQWTLKDPRVLAVAPDIKERVLVV